MFSPSSKKREIASCRRSWKRRSDKPARLLSLSHANLKPLGVTEKGDGVSVVRPMMWMELAANQSRPGPLGYAQSRGAVRGAPRNLCVFFAPRNHCPGVLAGSCVCCCNLCTTFCRLRAYGPTSVQSTSAISFVGRTLTCGAPACFGATSLSWPVSAKACLQPNHYVIFCYHLDIPINGVLFYRKFCTATREVPVGV